MSSERPELNGTEMRIRLATRPGFGSKDGPEAKLETRPRATRNRGNEIIGVRLTVPRHRARQVTGNRFGRDCGESARLLERVESAAEAVREYDVRPRFLQVVPATW